MSGLPPRAGKAPSVGGWRITANSPGGVRSVVDELAVDVDLTVFLDGADATVGSKGPFHPVYAGGTDR